MITPVEASALGTHGEGRGGHCVVVAGMTRSRVAIYDPQRADGPDEILLPRFQAAWQFKRCRAAVIRRIPDPL